MANADELEAVIKRFYGQSGEGPNIAALVSELGAGTESLAATVKSDTISESDNTLVRLVNKMRAYGLQELGHEHFWDLFVSRMADARFRVFLSSESN